MLKSFASLFTVCCKPFASIFRHLFLVTQLVLTLVVLGVGSVYCLVYYATTDHFRNWAEEYVRVKTGVPIKVDSIQVVKRDKKYFFAVRNFHSPNLDIDSFYIPVLPEFSLRVSPSNVDRDMVEEYAARFFPVSANGVRIDISDTTKDLSFFERCILKIKYAEGAVSINGEKLTLGTWQVAGNGGLLHIKFPEYRFSGPAAADIVGLEFSGLELTQNQSWLKDAMLSGSISGHLSLSGIKKILIENVPEWKIDGKIIGKNFVYAGKFLPKKAAPLKIERLSSGVHLDSHRFSFSDIVVNAYNGRVSGTVEVAPQGSHLYHVTVDSSISKINTGKFLATFLPGSTIYGDLSGTLKANLFREDNGSLSPRISGSLSIENGGIAKVRFEEGAQYITGENSSLVFDNLSGEVEIYPDHEEYKNVKLKAKAYNATGNAVEVNGNLKGEVNFNPLGLPGFKLLVSGTRSSPSLAPAPSSVAGAMVGAVVGGPIGAAIGASAGTLVGTIVNSVTSSSAAKEPAGSASAPASTKAAANAGNDNSNKSSPAPVPPAPAAPAPVVPSGQKVAPVPTAGQPPVKPSPTSPAAPAKKIPVQELSIVTDKNSNPTLSPAPAPKKEERSDKRSDEVVAHPAPAASTAPQDNSKAPAAPDGSPKNPTTPVSQPSAGPSSEKSASPAASADKATIKGK